MLHFIFRIPSADSRSCSIHVLQSCGERFWLCLLPSYVCRAVRRHLRRTEGKKLFFLIVLHLSPSQLEFMLSVDFVSWDCSKVIIGWNRLNKCDRSQYSGVGTSQASVQEFFWLPLFRVTFPNQIYQGEGCQMRALKPEVRSSGGAGWGLLRQALTQGQEHAVGAKLCSEMMQSSKCRSIWGPRTRDFAVFRKGLEKDKKEQKRAFVLDLTVEVGKAARCSILRLHWRPQGIWSFLDLFFWMREVCASLGSFLA